MNLFVKRVYPCTAPPWLKREHQFFISRAPHRLPNLVVSYHEVAMAFESERDNFQKAQHH